MRGRFIVEARSKYHIHCMEWNNKAGALNGITSAFPFLDRDLVQFLMAFPGTSKMQVVCPGPWRGTG